MLIYIIFMVIIACFSVVLLFGAPYLPTQKKQTDFALDCLGMKPGDTLLELGCGDGRVLRAAAKKGYRAVGYEINPLLFIAARMVTWRYRELVRVEFRNFWKADLSPADGVYVFLLSKFMKKLDAKLSVELRRGTKLASYAFPIPDRKALQAKSGIYVYRY